MSAIRWRCMLCALLLWPAVVSAAQVLSWNMDEASWTGAAGQVVDASGNGLDGSVFNSASSAAINPALSTVNAVGTCRYGVFESAKKQYIQRADDDRLDLQDSFTIGVWVRPSALPSSGLMTILSKDVNYEFHLKSDGSVNWWWQTSSPSATRQLDSTTRVSVGQWSHVVIRFAKNDQSIYINGTLAGQARFNGTPRANTNPLQLGNDQGLTGRYFNGQLDEVRIFDTALSPTEISALATERHTCPLQLKCFNDTFSRPSLGTDWATSSSGGSFGVPVIVADRMRLTNNSGNVATAATLQRLFPAAGNYVQVQFKHYAYNGSGADGVGVILSDASIAPLPGSYGGPLGYGSRGNATNLGFAGGWLGVGLDEYGNFSTEGGPGGPGRRLDSVAIRGSGAADRISGYRYVAGTAANLNPGIDTPGSTPNPGYTYRISVDGRYTGKALVTVERDTGAGFTVLPGINAVDVLAAAGQAGLPQNFYLSFTGSSGGSTNTHELDDLQVCATELNPIGQQIDHFDFSYASSALTCSPQPVTIKACMNASCSTLLTDPVSVSLSPSSGWTATAPATVSGGNTINFSGGKATVQLRSNVLGDVTVGVSSSTPVTKPLSVSTCTSTGCKINYADSGFLLTVPNLLAAKPTAATIQAVKKSDTSQACVPGFASGTRDVQFSSSYLSPASGTQPVFVNGTSVSATLSNVSLIFDAAARAPLTVRYDDAGQMTLNARYAPTSGTENGLLMTGNDNFVAKPYGLCMQTDTSTSCTAANTSCPLFPGNVRAGDNFSMRVKGVGWQADGEALTATELCTGNISTPNFQLGSIALSSTVIGPAGGSNGVLGVSSYSHVLGNQTTVSQTISEVGVFRLTATPASASYLDGETVSGGTSGNVGRFTPAYLGANASASLTPSCGSAFSYQGQPMAFAVGQEPALTVTGYNRAGGVTSNYDRGAFWRLATPTRNAYVSVTGKASLDASGRLTSAGSASLSQSGADNGDGTQSYRWSGETLTYTPATLPLAADLPFTAAVSQSFSAAALTDADTVCYLNGQASCQAYTYNFAASPGTAVRLGRLRFGNAHGSELQALSLPITLESWQSTAGGSFQPEGLDTCTNASVLGAPLLSDFTGNLATGETTPSLVWPVVGNRSLLLSAPGAGNDGSVQATLTTLPTWLYFDWNGSGRSAAKGLASFGIYAGPKPLIFRRELYR